VRVYIASWLVNKVGDVRETLMLAKRMMMGSYREGESGRRRRESMYAFNVIRRESNRY